VQRIYFKIGHDKRSHSATRRNSIARQRDQHGPRRAESHDEHVIAACGRAQQPSRQPLLVAPRAHRFRARRISCLATAGASSRTFGPSISALPKPHVQRCSRASLAPAASP
jgi:hypothetical protein